MAGVTDGRIDAPAPSQEIEREYRPHLDGLRAVAVYLVVAFHSGSDRLVGGFIGVDIFFVLSGYLITNLLVHDFRRERAAALRGFYARRVRRLLPSAFATLFVTAAVYSAVATPADALDAVGGFRASFLYVANWFFIGQSTDYWSAPAEASPVLHLWSLSVEEQFYLFWPVLLLGLHLVTVRLRSHQLQVMRLVVAGGLILSATAALRLSGTSLERAYYGTDTRAYQLLAGALLAMSPGLLRVGAGWAKTLQRIAPVILVAMVVVATPWVDTNPVKRGVAATVLTWLLLVALENAPGGLLKRALSTRLAVYLGKLSYGTYLWHWPVIVVGTLLVDIGVVAMFTIACLLATALAALSYETVERPIRESRRLSAYRGPVIVVGVAAGLLGGLVVVPNILEQDPSASATGAIATEQTGVTLVPDDLDWRSAEREPAFPDCVNGSTDDCIVVEGGSGVRVLLVGDSNAAMLLPAFEAMAEDDALTLAAAVYPACPWQRGINFGYASEGCERRRLDWYARLVPALDPDVIVLAERPIDDPNNPSPVLVRSDEGSLVEYGTKEFNDVLREVSDATLDELRDAGRKVVVIEPLPMTPKAFDPLACISQARYLDECRFVASAGPTPFERYLRSIAGADLWSFDFDQAACPYLPICDPLVNGMIVRGRANSHLTQEFATSLADEIDTAFVDSGVLSEET